MWSLLKKLFADEAAQKAPVEAKVEEKKEVEKRELVVGEPVISLAKSILGTDDWDVEIVDDRYGGKQLTFRHKVKALELSYYRYRSYRSMATDFRCLLEWLTADEHEYMLDVLRKWQVVQTEKANRERLRQQAEAREKFMVLVNN